MKEIQALQVTSEDWEYVAFDTRWEELNCAFRFVCPPSPPVSTSLQFTCCCFTQCSGGKLLSLELCNKLFTKYIIHCFTASGFYRKKVTDSSCVSLKCIGNFLRAETTSCLLFSCPENVRSSVLKMICLIMISLSCKCEIKCSIMLFP